MKRRAGRRVLVVGAGLGGISAAISLAGAGYQVTMFEKNERIGGKLNLLARGGFRFDLGPSIFILPHLYRRLFDQAGRDMSDYVVFRRVEPQWRSFFEDGTTVDLFSDVARMEGELSRLSEDGDGYWAFVEYSRQLFRFADKVYIEGGAETALEMIRGHGLRELLRGTDPLRTMDEGVRRWVKSAHLRHMLDFFIKYVGSSPYDAPALMNLLAYSQLSAGLWHVEGGMYEYARACGRLMAELGVAVHLGTEVVGILRDGRRARAVMLADGRTLAGDFVVCNMEVIPAMRHLLGEPEGQVRRAERVWEPACSGLVVHLGVNRSYPLLQHHNFFFSRDPREHFDAIHRRKEIPEDPTIYVVCPTRTDPSLAPRGHEIIKILPHVPHIQSPPAMADDYERLKVRLFDKLECMGLRDLREHIVCEHVMTPEDIRERYYSNRGSIYGVVADRWRNFALKAPRRSRCIENLYFVGGSVNPGSGTPMVIRSGQLVADEIIHGGS
jgi:diapolycopene oxygenase